MSQGWFLFVIALMVGTSTALIEMSGFHCMMRHSMRMNRRVHGAPQTSDPPFELHFLDPSGQETLYYEPGVVYTLRLVGFVHYRGLLLQSRLTNENGFLLGSLKGGRFIENSSWESYGIRLQECDMKMSTADSVTHADDSRKFVTQIEWTADSDVGPIQFMLTVAEEDTVYWERWRPRSGFILPASMRGKTLNVISEVFTDEKAAMRLAVKKRRFDDLLRSFYGSEGPRLDEKKAKSTDETTPSVRPERPSEETLVPLRPQPHSVPSSESSSTLQPNTEPLQKATTLNADSVSPASSHFVEERRSFISLQRALESDVESIDAETPSPSSETESAPSSPLPAPPPQKAPSTGEPQRITAQAVKNTALHFPAVNIDDLKSAQILKPSDIADPCEGSPCKNDGKCISDGKKEKGFACECAKGWTGTLCEMKDRCLNHLCSKGECISGNDSYTCECFENFAGEFCTKACPPNLCQRNGTCIEKKNGQIGCDCPAGSAGKFCEREINECNFRRCKHSVKCIDKWNDYECVCEPGWMGKNCDRPCQDVYGTCNQWFRQGQCDLMRGHTDFFDANCALSCEQCIFDESTIITRRPLPSVLLPFGWMLGVWRVDINGTHNMTVDYPVDFHSNGYIETLTVSVATPLTFGTPTINFTSVGVSKANPDDQHVTNGFLSIRNRPDEEILGALTTTSNLGLMMIEEGKMVSNSLYLTPKFRSSYPLTSSFMPKEMTRTFLRNGERLLQMVSKKSVDGKNRRTTKSYRKVETIEYL